VLFRSPFNVGTTILLDVEQSRHITVSVYDLRGRKLAQIAKQVFGRGKHTVSWDSTTSQGQSAPSGLYFFAVETDGQMELLRGMLIK